MDPYLLSLIEKAEAGAPTPGINLITSGGDWIKGQPCSSTQFREITWPSFVEEVDQALKQRPRRERKLNRAQASDVAAAPFAALVEKPGTGVPVLTLTQAFLSFGGRADGVELAAVRVPTDAISSWWVSGGRYVKPNANGGVVGGVLFPMGN